MKKEMFIQTQGVEHRSISKVQSIGWMALHFDNLRLVIDAYQGMGSLAEPRKDSLIEVVSEKEVFQLTPEQLTAAIHYYWKYCDDGANITRYQNRSQVIMPDRYKDEMNKAERAAKGLKF
jgi:hypothetical protein